MDVERLWNQPWALALEQLDLETLPLRSLSDVLMHRAYLAPTLAGGIPRSPLMMRIVPVVPDPRLRKPGEMARHIVDIWLDRIGYERHERSRDRAWTLGAL